MFRGSFLEEVRQKFGRMLGWTLVQTEKEVKGSLHKEHGEFSTAFASETFGG